jgi:hypothetical protein
MSSFEIVSLSSMGLIKKFVDEINKLLEAQEGYKTNLARVLSILEKGGDVTVVLNEEKEIIGIGQCSKQNNFSGPVAFIQIYISTDVKEYGKVYEAFITYLINAVSKKTPKSKHIKSFILSDSPTEKKRRTRSRILHLMRFKGSENFYTKIECE